MKPILRRGDVGSEVTSLQQELQARGFLKGSVDGDFGELTELAVMDFQRSQGLVADGIVGSQTWGRLLRESPSTANPLAHALGTLVERSQLEEIFLRAVTEEQVAKLNKALVMFEINTPSRIRHFLAQIGHESGGLRWFAEIADGSDYEDREDLGNTESGDGMRFKGVDPLQITGRYNYSRLAKYLDDPRVMEGWEYVMANYAFIPSGFWWHDNNMNVLVDAGASCAEVSTKVNGGNPANGLTDRLEYFARALEAIPDSIVLQPASVSAPSHKWTLTNINQSALIIPGGNFTWAEATRGGSRMPPDQEVLENIIKIATAIQKARNQIGRPFNITSWYRDPVSNAEAGGVSDSRHLSGDAIDFWVDGMTGEEIYNLLDPVWEGGLGRYTRFPFLCHVDARNYRARWTN
jgi:predicted chitinase